MSFQGTNSDTGFGMIYAEDFCDCWKAGNVRAHKRFRFNIESSANNSKGSLKWIILILLYMRHHFDPHHQDECEIFRW